jgi:hypothetical protein
MVVAREDLQYLETNVPKATFPTYYADNSNTN